MRERFSPYKVLVVNDLFDVPSAEKSQMEWSINFGLKGEYPILFINNIMNRYMSETFKSLIENYKGNLKIAEQTFSDEIISTKILHSCAFIKLIFFNCSFHKVNFDGSLHLLFRIKVF